ncbi:MAG TPA: serine/threonine-protein kinase, partial [Povalibacter sp.]|nr:serine/threonine-protein kinase [Povalibacter sp.]
MTLDSPDLKRLWGLLDESLELPPAQRNAWLAELEGRDAKSAEILRGLYGVPGQERKLGAMEDPHFLEHLSTLLIESPGVSPIGKRFGPYLAQQLLAQGGMGSVWRAKRMDGLFEREVALKLVHPALMGRVMTERLAREREILGGLSHPNIARLLDAGFTDDGQPYLALEYVDGTPLTTYCDDRQLTVRERLQLFRQVLAAVQYAHARLVIHRDLKPSNILVTGNGQVVLLDF